MADTNYVGAGNFLGIPSSFDDNPQGYRPIIGYANRGFVEAGLHGRRGAAGVDPNFGIEPIYGQPRYTEESALGIYSMSPGQVFKWQRQLAQAGLLNSATPGSASSTYSAYKSAMTEANRAGIPLKEYLGQRQAAMQRGALGAGASDGSSGGGRTSTSSSFSSTSSASSSMTSESISLTGRGQAESLLRQAMTQQLGRAPTNKEVAQFKRALNTQERKNPSVTKSTSNSTTTTKGTSSGSSQSTSSSTTGTQKSTTKQSDVDPGEEALDYARAKPRKSEREMYQDMQYYEAIAEMIGL